MELKKLQEMSKEALIAYIQSEQGNINEPPNDWPSSFYALLLMRLYRYRSAVHIEREHVLGAQPPRADFIVLREDENIDLGASVFQHFRRHNILEIKNLDDDLNQAVLWKAIGYVGFYISAEGVAPGEVPLTFFRGAKPVKLLAELGEHVRENPEHRGIYCIENVLMDVCIRIIVTTELTGQEYADFRTFSNKPDPKDVYDVIQEGRKAVSQEEKGFYRDFLDLLSKRDRGVMDEVRRRYEDMSSNLLDLLQPEITVMRAEERAEGRAEERDDNYNTIVKNLLERKPEWTKKEAEEYATALMKK